MKENRICEEGGGKLANKKTKFGAMRVRIDRSYPTQSDRILLNKEKNAKYDELQAAINVSNSSNLLGFLTWLSTFRVF